jgi:small subunit ribosomal protein S7
MNKKIINQLLLNGKTSTSKKIWLKSIKSLYKSITKNHKKVIVQAIINIAPLLKVTQPKEFPYIVSDKNRLSTSLSFFLNKTKPKSDTKIHTKLVAELLVTANNSGAIINEKKSLYEYAFIKKKFFYYR